MDVLTKLEARRAKVVAAYKASPEYRDRLIRHVNAREHTQACKLRVQEYFAGVMGMTVEQWQRASWHATR